MLSPHGYDNDLGRHKVFTSEEHLFPQLTSQDRHPSAPLLQSILSLPVQKPLQHQPQDEMMMNDFSNLGSQRSRSSSMPANTGRPPLPPQISISSPDEVQDMFCE